MRFAASILLSFSLLGCNVAYASDSSLSRELLQLLKKRYNLCTLHPEQCQTCGAPGTVQCPPQEDSGWLCCAEDGGPPCSVSSDLSCDDLFWCDYYTEETTPNGATHVICWDEWGQG